MLFKRKIDQEAAPAVDLQQDRRAGDPDRRGADGGDQHRGRVARHAPADRSGVHHGQGWPGCARIVSFTNRPRAWR